MSPCAGKDIPLAKGSSDRIVRERIFGGGADRPGRVGLSLII